MADKVIDVIRHDGIIDKNGNWIADPLLISSCCDTFSEGLCAVKCQQKYGYIDKTGAWVIEPQFDYAKSFSEGLARVCHDGKWGFIDKTGSMVFEYQFDFDNSFFSEGLCAVNRENKYGYIDKTGALVIGLQFDAAEKFCNGLAIVKINGKYGYIDKTGAWVIEPQFDYAKSFSEGLARVCHDGKNGYIDKTGAMVIEIDWDGDAFSEGIARVRPGWFKFGFIDKTGAWIIEPQLDYAESFSEGLAAVLFNDKYGYIDKTGAWVIEPQFDRAESFTEGLARVGLNDKAGFIDKTGAWVIEPKFSDSVRNFSDGLAVFCVHNKYGYIRKDGSVLVNPTFANAHDFKDGFAKVVVEYTRVEYFEKKRRMGKESLIRDIEASLTSHKLKGVSLFVKRDGTIVLRKKVYLNLTLTLEVNQDNYETVIPKLKDVLDKMPQLPKLKASDVEILPYAWDYSYVTRLGGTKEVVAFDELEDIKKIEPAEDDLVLSPEHRPYGEGFQIFNYKKSNSVPVKYKEISETLDELKYNWSYVRGKGFLIQLSSNYTLFIDVVNSGISLYSNADIKKGEFLRGYEQIKIDSIPQFLRMISSFNHEKIEALEVKYGTFYKDDTWRLLLCDGIVNQQCPKGTLFAFSKESYLASANPKRIVAIPFSTGMYLSYKFLAFDGLLNFRDIAAALGQVSEKSQEFCDYFTKELPEAKLLPKVTGVSSIWGKSIREEYFCYDAYLKDTVLENKAFLDL